MDSMRTLNTSLPSTTSPKKPLNRPPEQLLQSFKAAALSVTNLYKTAASDQAAAHESGYQEAIEDLIAFLDKERTGLKNGEGSRIRQWALERLQGGQQQPNSESDEEAEEEKRARSSSPILERKPSLETAPTTTMTTPVERSDSAPAASPEETRPVPSGDFTFRASHPYPPTNDSEMDTSETISPPMNAATSMPSMRLEVFPRASRNPNRHSNRSHRNITVPSLGPGAGMKRRQQIDELFDISNLGNGKDRFGGGKRGRFQ